VLHSSRLHLFCLSKCFQNHKKNHIYLFIYIFLWSNLSPLSFEPTLTSLFLAFLYISIGPKCLRVPPQQLRMSATFPVGPSTDPVFRSTQTICQARLPPLACACAPCLTICTTWVGTRRPTTHGWASQGARMSASLAAPPHYPTRLGPARTR
jgi:hypothetical protein